LKIALEFDELDRETTDKVASTAIIEIDNTVLVKYEDFERELVVSISSTYGDIEVVLIVEI